MQIRGYVHWKHSNGRMQPFTGRSFQYRYDNMGDRETAGETGTSSDDNYTANTYDQYLSKTNDSVRILGTVNIGAYVTAPNAVITTVDCNFGGSLLPSNSRVVLFRSHCPITATMPSSYGATTNQSIFCPGGDTVSIV